MFSFYPTAQDLAAMGATLEKDISLLTPALHRWLAGAHTQAVRTQAERADTPRRIVARPRKRAGKRIA